MNNLLQDIPISMYKELKNRITKMKIDAMNTSLTTIPIEFITSFEKKMEQSNRDKNILPNNKDNVTNVGRDNTSTTNTTTAPMVSEKTITNMERAVGASRRSS